MRENVLLVIVPLCQFIIVMFVFCVGYDSSGIDTVKNRQMVA